MDVNACETTLRGAATFSEGDWGSRKGVKSYVYRLVYV
jgi:hypothetical protein